MKFTWCGLLNTPTKKELHEKRDELLRLLEKKAVKEGRTEDVTRIKTVKMRAVSVSH